MTTLDHIHAYADHLAAGEGGDIIIPPATPPALNGRPRRLHLLSGTDIACVRCSFTILDPLFLRNGDTIDPESAQPLATREASLWRACPFNCELVKARAGRPTQKLAGNGY